MKYNKFIVKNYRVIEEPIKKDKDKFVPSGAQTKRPLSKQKRLHEFEINSK